MKVEIWSDVICPFCYIGKRRFEHALAQLPQRDEVEVIWRSFQLAPDTVTDPTRNAVQNLAEKKGWTTEYTRQALASIVGHARSAGLDLDYDRTIVANTFDAHRLSHCAAAQGKGDEMQERLFRAYFVHGRNIGDHETLTELAVGAGLAEQDVRQTLASDQFAEAVHRDLDLARRIGINGVPFFVFDRKYAVSGAQEADVFVEAMARCLGD